MEIIEKKISEYEAQRGKPMPSKNHSIIQRSLIFQLMLHYRNEYEIFSEISLELSDWESTPDIAIFPKMAIDFLEDEIRLVESPMGVIEILSPTQTFTELMQKINKYFKNGVKSCWLVLPLVKNIYVFSSITDYKIFNFQDTLKDESLNIELPVNEIFK
jgi:Uma2 family endonuclease